MTVEEMRKRIEERCISITCDEKCPLFDRYCCYNNNLTDEEIKENYKLMFGKEELEMKNEFDFNELKAEYAIKIPKYNNELLIGFQIINDILFYSKEHKLIVTKYEIMNEPLEDYIPIEVYGLSNNEHLFDSNTRPLLWKKKEDMNKKQYKIGDLIIEPNYMSGYKCEEKIEEEGFIYINRKNENDFYGIAICKSELDDVINALTEIRDFIKGDE